MVFNGSVVVSSDSLMQLKTNAKPLETIINQFSNANGFVMVSNCFVMVFNGSVVL